MSRKKRGGDNSLPGISAGFPYAAERLKPENGFDKELTDLTVALFESRYGLRFEVPDSYRSVDVTVLDLPGIPAPDQPNAAERLKLRRFLADMLNLEERDLDAPETLTKLNNALREGYNYLVSHQRFQPSLIPEVKELTSFEDLVTLMQSTKLYKPEDKRGSRRDALIVMNCALLTAAFASFELDKREMRMLRARTEYVESFFYGNASDRREALFIRMSHKNGPETAAVGIVGSNVTGSLNVRAKNRFRAMGKMIRDPKANAEEALKDGMGFRLEVPREHVGFALFNIISYLMNYLHADNVLVENQNMFSNNAHEWDDLKKKLKPLYHDHSIEYREENRKGRYRVVKVSADIEVPQDPNYPRSLRTQQRIEFQVVDVGNKNEAGLANHNVYELIQTFVEERTRLMGGISEAQLRHFASEVPKKGGPAYESIRDGLIQDGIMFQLPDTSVTKFASVKIWRRWVAVPGLLPPSIQNKIKGKLPR